MALHTEPSATPVEVATGDDVREDVVLDEDGGDDPEAADPGGGLTAADVVSGGKGGAEFGETFVVCEVVRGDGKVVPRSEVIPEMLSAASGEDSSEDEAVFERLEEEEEEEEAELLVDW